MIHFGALPNYLHSIPADYPSHTAPHTPPEDSDTPQIPATVSPRASNKPSPSPHMVLSSKD